VDQVFFARVLTRNLTMRRRAHFDVLQFLFLRPFFWSSILTIAKYVLKLVSKLTKNDIVV